MSAPEPSTHAFTYGHSILFNAAAKPAVLDSVSLWHAFGPIRIIAARADLIGRDAPIGTIARAPAFPPHFKITLHPLAGFPVPARSLVHGHARGALGVNIVLGLRVPKGVAGFKALLVRYHIGAKHYRLITHQGFKVCATTHLATAPDCPL